MLKLIKQYKANWFFVTCTNFIFRRQINLYLYQLSAVLLGSVSTNSFFAGLCISCKLFCWAVYQLSAVLLGSVSAVSCFAGLCISYQLFCWVRYQLWTDLLGFCISCQIIVTSASWQKLSWSDTLWLQLSATVVVKALIRSQQQ